jgi:hypothetical protein
VANDRRRLRHGLLEHVLARELLLLATANRAGRQMNVRIMPIGSGSLSRMRESLPS